MPQRAIDRYSGSIHSVSSGLQSTFSKNTMPTHQTDDSSWEAGIAFCGRANFGEVSNCNVCHFPTCMHFDTCTKWTDRRPVELARGEHSKRDRPPGENGVKEDEQPRKKGTLPICSAHSHISAMRIIRKFGQTHHTDLPHGYLARESTSPYVRRGPCGDQGH